MHAPDFWQSRGLAAWFLAPLGALYGLSVARRVGARPYGPVLGKALSVSVVAAVGTSSVMLGEVRDRLTALFALHLRDIVEHLDDLPRTR